MKRRALTLIELLAVVVLLGVAATLVAVRLHGATDGARLRGAALQVEQTLRLARQRAMTRHEPVWVSFRVGSNRYRLRTPRDEGLGWRALEGVTITQGAVGTELCDVVREGLLTLRVSPAGVTLPWTMELRAGAQRRTLAANGVSGVIASRMLAGVR